MNIDDKAYAFAAAFLGVKPKGSTPTIKLVKKLGTRTRPIVGKYRCYRLFGRWVIWDRIWVVDNNFSWSCRVHECVHALEARLGLSKSEKNAEAAEREAARGLT